MVFKPTLNLTEQIAEGLARKIVRGELAGHERIQELKIASELEVSRGSVREALLILERRHLIELVPRRGAVVNAIGKAEATAVVRNLAAAEETWFATKIEAIRNKDLPELVQALSHLSAMEEAARQRDVFGLIDARAEFYMAWLVDADRYTRAVFESMLPSSQVVLRDLLQNHRVDGHDVARYYRALYEALANRNSARLSELLGAFRRRLCTLCVEHFSDVEPAPMPQSVRRWSRRMESA